MTAPLSDRILDALGEPTARSILRRLLSSAATQAELVDDLGCDQSTVSRTSSLLRSLGLVEVSGSSRSAALVAAHRDELLGALLAADRLAESVIEDMINRQADRSTSTRRLAVRPAGQGAKEKERQPRHGP
jgi:DNA-binding transcriptional ArsR family regulator